MSMGLEDAPFTFEFRKAFLFAAIEYELVISSPQILAMLTDAFEPH